MSPSDVVLRPLEGIDECREAVAFQESIWGEGFSERVPASLLHVLPRVGSVAIGAWTVGRAPRMVGLVFGVTGVEQGRITHWSDILGVAPEARDLGLGRRLKLAQRRAATGAGAERMYWTFDPLEARNAWFNVGRLGARAVEYRIDLYGTPNSKLHRGIGTDRLIAQWNLREPVPDAPDDPTDVLPLAVAIRADADGVHHPVRRTQEVRADRPHAIAVPGDIQSLKSRAPELALRWRTMVRDAMTRAFDAGFVVVGVRRIEGGIEYRLDTAVPSVELPE